MGKKKKNEIVNGIIYILVYLYHKKWNKVWLHFANELVKFSLINLEPLSIQSLVDAKRNLLFKHETEEKSGILTWSHYHKIFYCNGNKRHFGY